MTEPKNEWGKFSKSRSIGMCYLNRFAINENDHFEHYGVYGIRKWRTHITENIEFNKNVVTQAIEKYSRDSKQGEENII